MLGSWIPPTGSGVAQGTVVITPVTQTGVSGQIVIAEPINVPVVNNVISQHVVSGNQLPQLRISEQIVGAPVDAYIISPPVARTDTVTNTSGSATITDAAILSADSGKAVAGAGVPIVSYVGAVTPGVSFTLVDAFGAPAPTTANVTSVVVGAVDLTTIARGPGATIPTYVLGTAVGAIGGPAGPLNGLGQVPAAQLPPAGAGSVTSVAAADGTIVVTGTPTVAPLIAVGTGIPEASITNLTANLGTLTTGVASASAAAAAAQSTANAAIPKATATTKGDLLAATANATVARLGVGGAGTFLGASSAASTGLAWLTPGGGGFTPVVRSAWLTSGDTSLPNTTGSWQALAGFELDVPAVAGQWVEIGVHAMRTATSSADLDIAVVVGSSIVRFLATGTATPGFEGDPGWYPQSGSFAVQSAPRGFVVASGDLDTGNVRFVVAVKATGSGTLFSSSNYPFYWLAKNLGVVA